MNAYPNQNTLLVAALFIGGGKVSTSFAQRKIGIGYNEAAHHVEALEAAHVISAANNVGRRNLLINDLREAKRLLGMEAQS